MPKAYTPRRASKRWLTNAPDHVLDLFKTKGGTYEALYTGPLLMLRNKEHGRTMANVIVPGREMDGDPSHPQGIGIWFELDAWGAARYRYANAKRRIKWDSLPEKVKACIMRDGPSARFHVKQTDYKWSPCWGVFDTELSKFVMKDTIKRHCVAKASELNAKVRA